VCSLKGAIMSRALVVVGVLLVTLGLLSLKYDRYSWKEEATATISTPVVDFELPAQQTHTIQVPVGVSWGAAGLGWVLVFVGVASAGSRPGARARTGPGGHRHDDPERSPQ
jgi:hypothetical protein